MAGGFYLALILGIPNVIIHFQNGVEWRKNEKCYPSLHTSHTEMNVWSHSVVISPYLNCIPGNIPTRKNHISFLLNGMKTLMIGKAKCKSFLKWLPLAKLIRNNSHAQSGMVRSWDILRELKVTGCWWWALQRLDG